MADLGGRAMKQNIEKQEKVVAALWDFAVDLQHRPDEGCQATIRSGKSDQTTCSTKHVETALRKIMDAFGYAVSTVL